MRFSRENLLRPDEVAVVLGATPKTLANWRCERRGPPFLKIGRQAIPPQGPPLAAVRCGLFCYRQKSYNRNRCPMSEHRYTVLFEPAEEGGYVVTCPALHGLVTEGNTYEEAHARAVEAIEGYLESLQKDGQPFPPDKKLSLDPVKEEIEIAMPEPA